MRRTGYTRASTLGPIAGVVAANGGSIERVFRRAELPIRLLELPDTLLPLRDHFRLLAIASRELRDEAFRGPTRPPNVDRGLRRLWQVGHTSAHLIGRDPSRGNKSAAHDAERDAAHRPTRRRRRALVI